MNRLTRCRWNGRTRRLAGGLFRCGLAFLLVLQIAYTPLHLYLEPHADLTDLRLAATAVERAGIAGHDSHDEHGDADQHSAAQHKLKSLRSPRPATVDFVCATVVDWVVSETDRPSPQVLTRSGLSPPELSGSWQFFFRTALPVRAPSLAS